MLSYLNVVDKVTLSGQSQADVINSTSTPVAGKQLVSSQETFESADIGDNKHLSVVNDNEAVIPGPIISYTAGPYARFLKPVIDRVGGVVLSIATAPLLGAALLAILVRLGRPLLFKQRRVGKHGQVFTIYKLRSMHPDRRHNALPFAGSDRRETHKSEEDPRLVPLGRILRRLSIDELPQFWNVVAGQMSLVGPRPELEEVVETKYESWQHQRHLVKPGVTGLWQVQLREQDSLMYKDTAVDVEYVDEQSFKNDMKILFKTPFAVLGIGGGQRRGSLPGDPLDLELDEAEAAALLAE